MSGAHILHFKNGAGIRSCVNVGQIHTILRKGSMIQARNVATAGVGIGVEDQFRVVQRCAVGGENGAHARARGSIQLSRNGNPNQHLERTQVMQPEPLVAECPLPA